MQHWRRLIEIESRMLDESSLSNNERIENDHCAVEENDVHVASYNGLSQIPQTENELNNDVIDFCNSYSSSTESDASVLDDPPEKHLICRKKKQSSERRNRSSRIQLQQLIGIL